MPGFRPALGALLLAVFGPVAVAGSLAPNLREALAVAGLDERIPVVVLMAEFPEGALLREQVRGMSRAERRAHVVSTLKGIAERSQGNLRALVTDGELRDRVSDIRVLWGVNGVALEAAADAITRLAELPEVGWVLYDRAPARADAGPDAAPERAFGDDRLSGPNPNATVAPDVVGARREAGLGRARLHGARGDRRCDRHRVRSNPSRPL